MTNELLTMPEAAALARVSERTLHTYIKTGRGPAVTKISNRNMFRPADFAAWIKANTNAPKAA